MSESRHILKNTLALTIARVVERTSSIVLVFFVSRTLNAAGLGVYSIALAYYGLITMAAEMGATNFLVRELAKDRANTGSYVVHLGVMGSLVAAVIMALAAAVLPFIGFSAELSHCLYIIILAILPGTLNTIQQAVFIAYQRTVVVTYTTVFTSFFTISLSLYFLARGYGVPSLVACFVVVKYVTTIFYFFFINSFAALRWEFHLPLARRLASELKEFAGLSLLAGVFAHPDLLILSLVQSEAQVGIYSAALKLVEIGYLLPQTFMTNVFPVLSRAYQLTAHTTQLIQERSVKYLLAFALPLAVGLTIAAEPLIKLVYGPGFEPAVPILRILAWTVPFVCSYAVLWRILAARGDQGAVLRIQAISTFMRLVGTVSLVLYYGNLGAAVATTLGMLLHNQLLSTAVKRDGTQLSSWRNAWRFLATSVMMGILLFPFSHQLQLWVLSLLGVTIYGLLVFLFKAFSPDDFALFRRVYLRAADGQVKHHDA